MTAWPSLPPMCKSFSALTYTMCREQSSRSDRHDDLGTADKFLKRKQGSLILDQIAVNLK